MHQIMSTATFHVLSCRDVPFTAVILSDAPDNAIVTRMKVEGSLTTQKCGTSYHTMIRGNCLA